MKIKEIMTKKVIAVAQDAPLSLVAALLFDNNISGLPVIDKNRQVIGIITEYDLLTRSDHVHIPSYLNFLADFKNNATKELEKEFKKIQNLQAKDIMTRHVITISPEAEAAVAAKIFNQKRINPLPVVNSDNSLVGIISRADIIKLLK